METKCTKDKLILDVFNEVDVFDIIEKSDFLDDRQKDIILSHYRDDISYQKIADKYLITRQRVQQIAKESIPFIKKSLYCNHGFNFAKKNYKNNIGYKNTDSENNRKSRRSKKTEPVEIMTIDGLSGRSKNCLARNGIFTIKYLISFLENTNRSKSPLLQFKNCGTKTSNEIYDFLINNGYITEKIKKGNN